MNNIPEPLDDVIPTPEEMQNWLKAKRKSSKWFTVFEDYPRVMSHEAAWLVQKLYNCGGQKPKSKRAKALRKKGWLLFTREFGEKKLLFSGDAQVRILAELQGKKKIKVREGGKFVWRWSEPDAERAFIEIRRFGSPPLRYVNIKPNKIDRAIQRSIVENHNVGNSNDQSLKKHNDQSLKKHNDPYEEGKGVKKKEETHKSRSETDRRQESGNETSPGFFNGESKVSDTDTKSAKQLLTLLRQHNRTKRAAKVSVWADQIRLLRSDLGDNPAQLEEVLGWYCEHITDRYTPKVSSAASFRDKFASIRDAMERASGNTKYNDTPQPVESSPEGLKVLKYLDPPLSNWTNGSADRMPAAIEQSLVGWKKIKAALSKLAGDKSVKAEYRYLSQHILDEWQHSPDDVGRVQQWFMFLHRQLRLDEWDDWSGKPNVLQVGDKHFEKLMREFARRYKPDRQNLWEDLKKEAGL